MNKIMIILCLMCLNISNSICQNMKGKIVAQEDTQPLPHATIKILHPDSTLYNIFSPDKNGKFEIKVPLPEFNLLITYLGYQEIMLYVKNLEKKDINWGIIELTPNSSYDLQEVIITANPIIENVQKMIVIPSTSQIKSSISGIDLLQRLYLPGLFIDPVLQKANISGTSGVIYRINGITSTLQDVNNLKAEQIQRVEYNQTPTARELDTNSGVINIIVRKETTGIYLATNTLGALSSGFINSNTNIKTVFSESELSLNYNVNWRDYTKRWSKEDISYNSPNDTISYFRDGKNAPFGYLSQNINLNYTFNNTNNIFLARFLNTIYGSFDRNFVDNYQAYPDKYMFFRNIYSKSNNYMPSLDIYYVHKITESKGIEANLVGTIMNSDYKRELADIYETHSDWIYNNTDGHKKSLLFESFFYNRQHKVNYNIGIKGAYSYTRNIYNTSEESSIKQFNVYPYISVDGKISNISFSMGTGLQILNIDDREKSRDYYKNLTTISLFYSKKNWNIRNVFRYTPSFPNLSYLSNVDQKQDSLMTIKGNPAIKPSQTISNRVSLTYQMKKNIRTTLGLNASKTFDPIRNNFYYDTNIGSFITQRDNQDYERQIGANLDITLSSIFNIFNISTGASWNNYKSKGLNYSYNLDNFYWYIFCHAQFNSFSIDGGYRKASKDLYGQVVYLNENYSSIGASYKKKNLVIGAGIMFPFTYGTKYGTEQRSAIVPLNKSIYIRDNANMFYLQLAYNISWGKSIFNIKKNLNNSDWDNGIMKIQDN